MYPPVVLVTAERDTETSPMFGIASRISSIEVPSAFDSAIEALAWWPMAVVLYRDGSTVLPKERVSNASMNVPVSGSVPVLVSATMQLTDDSDGM